ncbi:MAG: hypothetical protein C4339_06420 [Nitrososphaerota archaeon]
MALPPQQNRKLVGFEPLEESWNYYGLEDGRVLAVKLVVTKVFKILDPSGAEMRDFEGNPIYFVLSQNVMRVFSPEEWKEVRARDLKR